MLGVSTEEIARLFLTSTPTMAARITRAKRKLVTAGVPLAVPDETVLADRVGVVASVAYLAFTAGYAPGSGPDPVHTDLAADGVRLARAALLTRAGDLPGARTSYALALERCANETERRHLEKELAELSPSAP